MTQTLRNGVLLGMLAIGAVATLLVGRQEAPAVTPSEMSASPTFYLRDAAILGTDPTGYISYRIFATLVEQPEQDQPLVLSNVRVEYDARENVPWLVTAVRATVNRSKIMRLHEARLSSLPEPGTPSLLIETDELELDAEAYLARAEHPVVLSRGSARVEAQALTADLKQNRIVLESGHGQFHR